MGRHRPLSSSICQAVLEWRGDTGSQKVELSLLGNSEVRKRVLTVSSCPSTWSACGGNVMGTLGVGVP